MLWADHSSLGVFACIFPPLVDEKLFHDRGLRLSFCDHLGLPWRSVFVCLLMIPCLGVVERCFALSFLVLFLELVPVLISLHGVVSITVDVCALLANEDRDVHVCSTVVSCV
jgi:hypothetical protein